MRRYIPLACIILAIIIALAACQDADYVEVPEIEQDARHDEIVETWGEWIAWAGWAEWLECPDIASRMHGYRGCRLRIFWDHARVYSMRRGIVMGHYIYAASSPAHSPMASICNYCYNLQGEDSTRFRRSISLCPRNIDNEDLKNALLTFTGLSPENVQLREGSRMFRGGPPQLPAQMWEYYDMLQDFRYIANAAFLEDRRGDPVIVSIALPCDWWNPREYFIIWLYNPDLLGLRDRNFAARTSDLKAEIMAFTGMEANLFRLRVWEPPASQ